MAGNEEAAAVKACYATWSDTYYAEYYGLHAPYPPVHQDVLKRLIKEAHVKRLLDAGCGPASFLRSLVGSGIELYGFDLTSEMVTEARRVLSAKGVPPDHVWEGSVLSAKSFCVPRRSKTKTKTKTYDAAVCIGVFPHLRERDEWRVLRNLRNAVKRNGLVVVEARNQLFALTTMNRYSYRFLLDELIRPEQLRKRAGREAARLAQVFERMKRYFRMDLPPLRKGKDSAPGYDQVLSRVHNPFVLRERFAAAGFEDTRLFFYHYHCLPPMFEPVIPRLFRRASLAMEDSQDWRGYFLASAFLLAGRRA